MAFKNAKQRMAYFAQMKNKKKTDSLDPMKKIDSSIKKMSDPDSIIASKNKGFAKLRKLFKKA